MKKLIFILLVIVCIGGLAVATRPDKQSHKQAILAVINEKVSESVDAEVERHNGDYGELAILGKAFASTLGDYALDRMLTVKDHLLYTEGTITKMDGQTETVSYGVFGHVFTFKKEDIDKALDKVRSK